MAGKTFVVTKETFEQDVLSSYLPVLVDFWAEWCGPCKMIAPFVAEISEEFEGKLRVGKLDADENQEVLMQYGIMGIPTLILFKNGEPVERLVGFMPKDNILARIEPHLN